MKSQGGEEKMKEAHKDDLDTPVPGVPIVGDDQLGQAEWDILH